MRITDRFRISIVISLCLCIATAFSCSSSPANIWSADGTRTLQDNLEKHTAALSVEIGDRNTVQYEALRKSERYISRALGSYDYTVIRQEYQAEGRTVANIIARKEGLDRSLPVLVIGAHYDSCFTPGADDNASGVAGLLELARLLRTVPLKRSIEFAAFVNEEPPFFKTELMGSWVYASKQKNVHAALILECIGYYSTKPGSQKYPSPAMKLIFPDTGDFIAVIGNTANARLVRETTGYMKKENLIPVISLAAFQGIPGIDFSDHWSFYEHDLPAVMITDTAFNRNRNYHTENDLPGTLDYPRMTAAVKAVYSAAVELSR